MSSAWNGVGIKGVVAVDKRQLWLLGFLSIVLIEIGLEVFFKSS